MEAIRQIIRIPRSHEVKIKIPDYLEEDELMEVLMLVNMGKRSYKDKILDLQEAVKDPDFIEELEAVNRDFENVDMEGWE
ncbi:MAG: hypothetical protein L0Y73_09485 [Candidatus Aminicenantes bacterium]|nr:hypothetical protein [Candidatus Aminicenantes bacterium]MDQ1354226.1 hypothetical protein [Acidobacteriota bacterium]